MKTAKQTRNELAARVQAGDAKARRELVPAMEGPVVIIASKIRNHSGLPFEDLENEAWVQVFQCVERFDSERPDADFGGMCGYWIEAKLKDFVASSIGAVRSLGGQKMRKAASRLRGVVADGEARGLTLNQALREAARVLNVSERDVATLYEFRNSKAVGEEVGEHVVVSDKPAAVEEVQANQTRQILLDLMESLPDGHKQIVLTHVLDGKTFDSMADEGDRTRERYRQRFMAAMKTLRTEAQRRGLSLEDLL